METSSKEGTNAQESLLGITFKTFVQKEKEGKIEEEEGKEKGGKKEYKKAIKLKKDNKPRKKKNCKC